MNIGIIGLGKLGLPVAVTLSKKHRIFGFDVNSDLMRLRSYPHKEMGPELKDDFQNHFDASNITFSSLPKLVNNCDLIFVAVQTPHCHQFEGVTRINDDSNDFDYTYLIEAVKNLSVYLKPHQTVVVISTVLPGTLRKYVMPILGQEARLAYNPLFIAMGTVMYDFMNPEFILLGSDHYKAQQFVKSFYEDLYGRDIAVTMGIESAELSKVIYNTFISLKIVYANSIMEICHKVRKCNVDDVSKLIAKATNRLLSPKYMTGGMGDGGGCHPRDNIAMSWLAKQTNLSYNIFKEVSLARERQSDWLIDLMMEHDLPKVILGKSFKPETNIQTGSPAILCANLLKERNVPFEIYDPYIDAEYTLKKSVFLIATKHNCFKNYQFPKGSVVIDPHRYIPDQDGVKIIWVGIGRS